MAENEQSISDEMQALLHLLAHDVKAPIGIAKTFVELIEADLGEDLSEDQHEMFGGLRTKLDLAQDLVQALVEYHRLDMSDDAVMELDLATELSMLPLNLTADRKIAITPENFPPTIHCHGKSVRLILARILENAARHGDRPVTDVTVRYDGDADGWTLTITDNGPGIKPIMLDKVLNYGFSASPRTHGLGLALAAKLVKRLGGQIAVSSPVKDERGTQVRLTLPFADPD